MVDQATNKWVCPDDRQLILRSRLGAGWSYWTAEQESLTYSPRRSGNETSQVSSEEQRIVADVIARAADIDRDEEERIGRLVVRLEQLKKAACFDGSSKCAVCGERVRIFPRTSTVCAGCKKGVCQSCSAKTSSDDDSENFVLCKVCLEEREVWKKTGAWFYKMMPRHSKPTQKGMSHTSSPTPDRIVKSWSNDEFAVHPYHLSSDFDQSYDSQVLALGEGMSIELLRKGDYSSSSLSPSHASNPSESFSPSRNKSPNDESDLGVTTPRKCSTVSQQEVVSNDGVNSIASQSLSHRIATTALVQAAQQARRFSLGREPSEERELIAHSLLESTNVKPVSSSPEKVLKGSRDKPFGRKKRIKYGNELNNEVIGVEEEEEEDVDELLQEMGQTHQHHKSTDSVRSHGMDLASGQGTIHFSILYDTDSCEIRLELDKCRSLAIPDHYGPLNPFVKLDLLPSSTKARLMTSNVVQKTATPSFQQLITYPGILESDIKQKTLRLCVMHAGRLGNEVYIGETRLSLKKVTPNKEERMDRVLEKLPLLQPDTKMEKDDRGVIQVALEYLSDQKRLVVGILQAAGLAPMDSNGLSDPFVKCYLHPDPHKKTKRKTNVIKKTLNPKFNKEFTYTMKAEDLAKMSLEITVWDHDLGRNDYIGGIRMGKDAKGELLLHWYKVLTEPNQKFTKWHKLSPDHVSDEQ